MKVIISLVKLLILLTPTIGDLPLAVSQDVSPKSVIFTDRSGNRITDVEAWHFKGKRGSKLVVDDGEAILDERKGLVVARATGFQYSGAVLESIEPTKIVFQKSNEQGRNFKTLPIPLTDLEKKNIVDGLIEECWSSFTSNYNDVAVASRSGKSVAKLVPGKCLEFIDSKDDIPEQIKMMIRSELMVAFARTNVETVIELSETIGDPMTRASSLGRALLVVDKEHELLPAIENELISVAKSIKQPAYRLAMWAVLAEHYLLTGRQEYAKRIVDSHLEEARQLPSGGWSAYPKSLFAAMVVADRPEVAQRMIEGNDGGSEANRAIGRLAFHCCQKHPRLAIELLTTIKEPANSVNQFNRHIKVCGQMVATNLDLAFELAKSITEPNQQAWAYGIIARRLSTIDSVKAVEALDLAISAIESDRKSAFGSSKATTLAGLIPIAEKIAPGKIESMIWRTVYYSIPKSRWVVGGQSPLANVQNAAAVIARYDRKLALTMDPGSQMVQADFDPFRLTANVLVLGPDRFEELIKQIQIERPGVAFRAQDAAIQLLTTDEVTFWDLVSKPSFLPELSQRYEDF